LSVVGIVALSLLVGAFLIAIIGLSVWLVYLILRLREGVSAFNSACKSFTDETGNLLTLHRSELRSVHANLDQSLITRLSELDDTITKFGTILNEHRVKTDAQIQRINGQELSAAVARFDTFTKVAVAAATRIERAGSAIGTFTREWISQSALGEDLQPVTEGVDLSTGYAVTEPGESPFVSRSRTAADDAAVLADESAEVTQTLEP